MVYRAIGVMSGSSLDGLDIAFAEFQQNGQKWEYALLETACYPYSPEWINRLKEATSLSAQDYQLLHTDYGHYIGQQVNNFISEKQLQYKVSLVSSHGHTSFHLPDRKMTAQLGDGAAIAAETGLPVISDLRALDVALGGQGAPIVPIGEKNLLHNYSMFLNIGGIANISMHADNYIAFDVCPANRVLNLLAGDLGMEYDRDGDMAASGSINEELLKKLNALDYYKKPFPKSLANEFGTGLIYPMLVGSGIDTKNVLRTYTEHIAAQVAQSVEILRKSNAEPHAQLLVTGGGAFNKFLAKRLQEKLVPMAVEVVVPGEELVNYKEALIMAFIGVLRWRQEYNVLSSVTGASRDSIGGALWMGAEA